MNSIKQLAGQTAIYGLSTIIGRLLNYLLVPLHTYLFAPNEYGVVGELYAWVSLFIVILTYGMETAYFKFSQEESLKDRSYSTIIFALLTTSTLFIAICTIFAQPIANFLHYNQHPEYIIWLSAIIGIDALTSIFFARLRKLLRALKFALVKLTNIGINIILNLFFLLLCPYLLQENILPDFIHTIYNPEIGVGYIFISNLIASIVTLLLLLPELFKIKIVFDLPLFKKMFAYAFPLLILGLAGIVNETMDRILLKKLSPEDIAQSQVGIYSACYKISIMMTIFIQAFKYAAEPFFFSKSKDKDAKNTYSEVMTIFVCICSIMFVGIMLYIDIIKYFVGTAYHVGLSVVPILLLANLFLGIFYNLSIWYKLTGQTKFGAYISLIGASITLLFNYLLIPSMGYMGAAWTTFICYFTMMVLSYFWGQKYYPVNYQIKRITFYLVLAVIIYLLSSLLRTLLNTVTTIIIINTILFIVYLMFIIYINKNKIKALLPIKPNKSK